jgi:segregation and condensation protein B
MSNSIIEDTKLIQAILFLENEPVDVSKLVQISNLRKAEVENALSVLRQMFNRNNEHGIQLVEFGGGYHFVPKQELWDSLKHYYGRKPDKRLSRAALEILSIVAYSQPITRKEIDNIRGVSSDNGLRLLLDKDYVKAVGKKDVIGHPYLYGTTKKFLQDFKLKSISALPKLKDIDYDRFEEE